MDVLQWVTDSASSLPPQLVWALGGLFAFLENGVGLGFFLPGETIVLVLSATFDSAGAAVVMFLVVAVAGCAGDHIGYLLGRRFGGSFRNFRLINRLGVENWDRAVAALERRGAIAVFLTRLIPIVRTLTPAAAGVARVPYPTFVLASLAGAGTWAALYVGVGFLLRSSLDAVRASLGPATNILILAVIAVAAIVLVVRAIRRRSTSPVMQNVETSPHERTLIDRLFREDQWRTWPNLISLIRLLLLPVFTVLLVVESYWAAVAAIAVVFASDGLDGWLARRTGTVSALGAWLDPVADRITAVIVAISFAAAQLIPWQTIVLLLIPDTILGLVSLLVFRGDPGITVTRAGKVRTALLFSGLFVLLTGMALSTTGLEALRPLVGLGFILFLFGIIGHYIAASQYARAMLTARLTSNAHLRAVHH